MSRRREAVKRITPPDTRLNSVLVTQFINCIMGRGKKSIAEGIVYGSIELGTAKSGKEQDSLEFFSTAVENVKPILEVKSRRVGGANYQVPVEVRIERRVSLAIRWIIDAARKRGEKTMRERLANELIDAFNNTGTAVKKKEDTHRMAEANKAFAHYRW